MKNSILILAVTVLFISSSSFAQDAGKLVSKAGHMTFFSHTDIEDITANNYKVVSTIEPATGRVVFSAPMQAFEFEKAMMQKHYNSEKFLDTKAFPKSKFTGTITNLDQINFSKDGTYEAIVKGDLELHGVTKTITEKGKITVKGSLVTVDLNMNITLADYKIAFTDGKPSTNIAKTVDVTVKAEHKM
jgi:polyisoprenoid-binding protein YceI